MVHKILLFCTFAVIGLSLFLVTSSSAAQDTSNGDYPPFQFTEEEARLGGRIEDVFYRAPYTFVGRSDATVIYDVSAVDAPVEVATIPNFTARAFTTSYLYGENWTSGIWEIWDVNNPLSPILASTFHPNGLFVNATAEQLFFRVGELEETAIVGYSLIHPTAPVFYGSWDLEVPFDPDEVHVEWSTVVDESLVIAIRAVICERGWCTTLYPPLSLIEYNNPSSPVHLFQASEEIARRRLFAQNGSYLYQVDEANATQSSQLHIYEIDTDRITLTPISTYALDTFAPHEITLHESVLYLTDYENTRIIDVSMPQNPMEVDTIAEVVGGKVYDTLLFGLFRYPPTNPLYLPYYSPYLTIFDVQQPMMPMVEATIFHAQGEVLLKGAPNRLYLVDSSDREVHPTYIHTIDTTIPSAPQFMRTDPFTNSQDIAPFQGNPFTVVQAEYLYVEHYEMTGNNTLYIYHLPTETTPLLFMGTLKIDGYIAGVVGNALFIGSRDGMKVYIYEISEPTTPTLVSDLEIKLSNLDIIGEGNYAYIGEYASPQVSTIYILNIADPSTPIIEGQLSAMLHPDLDVSWAIRNGYLYYYQEDGIHIADVRNPELPQSGNVFTPSVFLPLGSEMMIHEDRLYLYSEACPLRMATYSLTEPKIPRLWSQDTDISDCSTRFLIANGSHYYGLGMEEGGIRTFQFVDGVTRFLPLLQKSPS